MGQLTGLAGIIRGGLSQSDPAEQNAPHTTVEPKHPRASGPRLARFKEKPAAGKGKQVTKSKDPAWKAYSLFLKKDTHSEMNFLLRKLDAGEDMSDLVQRLVESWVAANR